MDRIFDELKRMQQQIDNTFKNFFEMDFFNINHNLLKGPKGEISKTNYKLPLSNIYETDKEIIAEIEMPGVDKKDIKIQIDKNGIEIKAENKAEIKQENQKKGIYRFERNYSGFYRYFSLPSYADTEKANAEYKNGILKIIIPKLKIVEEKKKKLIEVK